MFELIWCNICNSRPADGKLLVLLEGFDEPQELDACIPCVHDPEQVEFVV